MHAATDAASAGASGVDHGALLLAFTEAVVGEDDAALGRARADLLAKIGPAGVVDAAAVASNFERMVRIADATGIPLDAPVTLFGVDLHEALDLGRFAGAAATGRRRAGRARQALARALRPAAMRALQRLTARRSESARARGSD